MLPIQQWRISTGPDLRREGGIVCGDNGNPIMLHMWPTFEQIATALKDRDESAAARDGARELLTQLPTNLDIHCYTGVGLLAGRVLARRCRRTG